MKKDKQPNQKNHTDPVIRTIGEIDADNDVRYLPDCFVYTADYEQMRDQNSIRSILVGRTGSGKTAFLNKLKAENDYVIEINAGLLELEHISNTQWIIDLAHRGHAADSFFKFLWLHVFMVHIIREEFSQKEERSTGAVGIIERLKGSWRQKNSSEEKKRWASLVEYLNAYEDHFWDPRASVTRMTMSKLSDKTSGQLGFPMAGVKAEAANEKTDDFVEKESVRIRDSIIQPGLIQGLLGVISIIGNYLSENRHKFYYLVIDRLDEVRFYDSILKRKIIKALIEAIKEIKPEQTRVKVIPALRRDLLDFVYENNDDPGFQSEKFRAFEIQIRWSLEDLRSVVDKRISRFLSYHYMPSKSTGFDDLFPLSLPIKGRKQKSASTFDHMIERTLNRPRDIITFVNRCIEEAMQKNSSLRSKISAKQIYAAEAKYSQLSVKSVEEEWDDGTYPRLKRYIPILQGDDSILDFPSFLRKVTRHFDNPEEQDWSDPVIERHLNSGVNAFKDLALELAQIFYTVGIIKIAPYGSADIAVYPDTVDVTDKIRIHIHPMFSKALHVRLENTQP